MINWREFPFIRILIPFIVGIIFALRVDIFFPFGNILLVILFVGIAIFTFSQIPFKFRSLFGLFTLSFFFFLGYQLSYKNNNLHQSNHFQSQLLEENSFIGTVTNMPIQDDWTKLIISVSNIKNDGSDIRPVIGQMLVYVKPDDLSQQLKYGDLISFHGKANPISISKNPKAFDFKKHLFPKNIHHQIFIQSKKWTLLKSGLGNPILSKAYQWRKHLLNIFKSELQTRNEYAVAAALILGYKDELSPEIKNAFSQTGAMHVLAVSGLHVGLIMGLLSFILGGIKLKSKFWKILQPILLILGLWGFAIITGASPSVLRAALMFSFIIIGRAINRDTSIYNILAASAFFLLIFDPFLIMEIGFQLSYLALIGIVYFTPKIHKKWYIKNKVGDFIWKLVALSLAAQITTLPISLYYFHQFPVYFWLSGIVVVPAAFIILSVGLLLILLSFTPLSSFIAGILWWIIVAMNSLIFLIQKIPFSLITGIWISILSLIVLYLIVSCFIIAINTKRSKWVIFAGIGFLLLSVSYAVKTIKQYNQKEVVIYSVYKNSLIDFIDGKKLITIKNEELEQNKIDFANRNYHWYKAIDQSQTFLLEDKYETHQDKHFIFTNGFIQFYDIRLGIIDGTIPSITNKIKLDYILIRNSPKLDISTLQDTFEFKHLIVDGSNKQYKINQWKLECAKLNIPFIDVANEGAFIFDFEQHFKTTSQTK